MLMNVQGDYQIISNVAQTLKMVVPLIEHPSEIFLSQLEEASVKLILQHDKTGSISVEHLNWLKYASNCVINKDYQS